MRVIENNLKFRNPLAPLHLFSVKHFVLHHIEAEFASLEDIHSWHLENGWNGVGYNEYIRKDGTVYIGRGMHVGSHCLGNNATSYGIALEGNFEYEHPSEEQIKSLVTRIKHLNTLFPNDLELKNHWDLVKTACPVINLVELARQNMTYEEKTIFERYEDLEKENEINKNTIENLKEENLILKANFIEIMEDNKIYRKELEEIIEKYEDEETRLVKIVKKAREYGRMLYNNRKK